MFNKKTQKWKYYFESNLFWPRKKKYRFCLRWFCCIGCIWIEYQTSLVNELYLFPGRFPGRNCWMCNRRAVECDLLDIFYNSWSLHLYRISRYGKFTLPLSLCSVVTGNIFKRKNNYRLWKGNLCFWEENERTMKSRVCKRVGMKIILRSL